MCFIGPGAPCCCLLSLPPSHCPPALFWPPQALPPAQRLAKVERWALLGAEDRSAVLAAYPPGCAAEVEARVAALQGIQRLANIQRAMAALHVDDDFQADAAQPRVREAIEALRRDPSQYERYAGEGGGGRPPPSHGWQWDTPRRVAMPC